MIATRLTPGASSMSNSSHLPPSVASMLMKPVRFPPGRGRLATKPALTGSATEVDGWPHKLSRVSQNRAAVQSLHARPHERRESYARPVGVGEPMVGGTV